MIEDKVIDGRIEKALRVLRLKVERAGVQKSLKRHAAYIVAWREGSKETQGSHPLGEETGKEDGEEREEVLKLDTSTNRKKLGSLKVCSCVVSGDLEMSSSQDKSFCSSLPKLNSFEDRK